jgi:anaerobic ribonucleoside-triphosphate reductase activating protein
MRIAGIIKNDVVNGNGVCVSLFTQGCPHHCLGCFNPQTWDFNGGYESNEVKSSIIKAIGANGIQRNFSILGGEPLCPENRENVKEVLSAVRVVYPNIKVFLWTGYTLSELLQEQKHDENLKYILSNINYLIDGKFIQEEKDLSLWLRGSRNQNVYELTKDKKYVKINKENMEGNN